MARIALDRTFQRDRGLEATHRIEKIDIHGRLNVQASSGCRGRPRPRSAKTTSSPKAAEQITEIIHVETETA
jgi:hypothetical protein